MSKYEVCLEISGPTALWTRPDTGDSPGTFPVPPCSAAKGIFESILRIPAVEVIPTKVEICAPLIHHHYTTNYGGRLRKSKQKSSGSSYQLYATVLINVCYRLYAEVRAANISQPDKRVTQWLSKTTSPAHAYQDIFNRRLKRGQCFAIPCLGWKEFVPDYVGPFRDGTRVQTDIDLTIPSMTYMTFPDGPGPDGLIGSRYRPTYKHNLKISEGKIEYKGDENAQ